MRFAMELEEAFLKLVIANPGYLTDLQAQTIAKAIQEEQVSAQEQDQASWNPLVQSSSSSSGNLPLATTVFNNNPTDHVRTDRDHQENKKEQEATSKLLMNQVQEIKVDSSTNSIQEVEVTGNTGVEQVESTSGLTSERSISGVGSKPTALKPKSVPESGSASDDDSESKPAVVKPTTTTASPTAPCFFRTFTDVNHWTNGRYHRKDARTHFTNQTVHL